MAAEPADVLIIGAGASGGVVAKRLAEAGFKVVCLEQGDWHDRDDYPGNKLDWELHQRKSGRPAPTSAASTQDYPIVEDDTPVSPLMYNAVGGSTLIFAGAWPRALPSDFRVRSLDGVADDWPIDLRRAAAVLLPNRPRLRRQSACPATRPIRRTPRTRRMPPLPIGAAGLKVARAHTQLGWHWWPEFNSILSRRRTTAAGRASSAAPASRAATRAPRPRPT